MAFTREAAKGDDAGRIRAATQALAAALARPETASAGGASETKDDVIDAEFQDVSGRTAA